MAQIPPLLKRPLLLALAGAAVLAIALAACGSDDSSDGSSSTDTATAAAGSSSAATVSVQSIGGADVLVDADGNPLYTNDQDSANNVKCTGECASVWPPLAAPSGSQPSSDDATVNGELGTVDLPDGTTQVTFDGKPLYTFTPDSGGQATGDGVTDSFGGVSFSWTVASPSGDTSGDEGAGGGYGGGY
ncbi:MAG: COG4315 family predicted lipoprotein [Gaiellaceae bacterium]